MAHRDSQKQLTAPQSAAPSQVVEAEAIADAQDFDKELDHLLSELINTKESLAKSMPDSKAEYEAAFGSMDAAFEAALVSPEIRKVFEDRVRAHEHMAVLWEKTNRNLLDIIIKQLANVHHWKALAASDPQQFRSDITILLQTYRKTLNSICRIKSHRPEKRTQNSLIYEIKSSKPNWSFGRVAHEYTRRTGKPMTAKIAERTYSRTKPNPDILLDFGETADLPTLKSLQNARKASGLLRRKSPTT